MRAQFIEFLEAVARVVDKASPEDKDLYVYNASSPRMNDESMNLTLNEDKLKERIHRPLNLKLKSFFDMVLARCVSKGYKERYDYPELENPIRMIYVVK